MRLAPGARKALLAVHLTCSCGWIGMVLGYLALGVTSTVSSDVATVRAAWVAMELTGWSVLVPLAVGSLVTGTWLALGTRWGLFRHYWVVFAFAMTSVASVVLVLHMPSVSRTATMARGADEETLAGLGGDLVHTSVGLALLLVILVLNVYKPSGLTRYGWRQRLAANDSEPRQPLSAGERSGGTSRDRMGTEGDAGEGVHLSWPDRG